MLFIGYLGLYFHIVFSAGYVNNDNRLKYPFKSDKSREETDNRYKAAKEQLLREIEHVRNQYSCVLNQYEGKCDPLSKFHLFNKKNELKRKLDLLENKLYALINN
ncbi:hypothetical protein EDEG_00872 [Edhazardia aedis USNM 41457]|uniref:Enkurin domain-containing protein n=1 Tax=Edhazardia aedis (strain USNM 41457) TaxID=1003232 RepID=J9DUR8_EDHAE|nr:hypothetical protein EDEG_00872 [Edhazardia aedis USNM 41457]|eukprot:EJW05037.1 hypothetical protein EDEG_00872 [Edhazardia aedis USNM 41457]